MAGRCLSQREIRWAAGRGRLAWTGRQSSRAAKRFRAVRVAVLLARRVPPLLPLDEPSNHLDLASSEALVCALHDSRLLADVGVDRELDLSAAVAGGLGSRP